MKLSPIARASSSAAYSDCVGSRVSEKYYAASRLLRSATLGVRRIWVDFACFLSSIDFEQKKSVYGQCLSSQGMKRSESLNSL